MTPDEVLAVLRSAVSTVLEIDPARVQRETRFVEDLRADPLALVKIVEIFEAELVRRSGASFGLDDEVLESLETVGDAVDRAVAEL
jgi:acyl carrier protein